jgi:Domain of unknown function (DUF4249)
MKKLLYLFILMSLSLILNSCVDSVPFVTKSEEGFLSIVGTFHNLSDTQFIKLFRSQGYTAQPTVVSDAKITVFGNDNKSGSYEEIKPGVYALKPNILRGQAGTSYYVEIRTKDGKIYRSQPEVMPAPVKPDSISFSAYDKEELSSAEIKTKNRTLKIQINTPLKIGNSDAFLRWNIEDSFEFSTVPDCSVFKTTIDCFYSRKSIPTSRIALASSKDLLISRADALSINETSLENFDLQFKKIHYWQIYQNSITENAYNYWKNIDKVSNQVGSLFDVSPAYVKGNVYNVSDPDEKVLGYFEVAGVEKIVNSLTIGIINRDFGTFIPATEDSPCINWYAEEKYTLCCQCPRYEIDGWSNSPYKPSYWK